MVTKGEKNGFLELENGKEEKSEATMECRWKIKFKIVCCLWSFRILLSNFMAVRRVTSFVFVASFSVTWGIEAQLGSYPKIFCGCAFANCRCDIINPIKQRYWVQLQKTFDTLILPPDIPEDSTVWPSGSFDMAGGK